MLQREVSNGTQAHACPLCGAPLARNGDLLMCKEHGAFFAYGPHLLVRAPAETVELQNAPLPWEVAPKTEAS